MRKKKVKSAIPQTNVSGRQLRAYAWRCFTQHHKKLLIVALLAVIPAMLNVAFRFIVSNTYIQIGLNFALTFIFAPLTVGTTAYYYETFMHGDVKLNYILQFYQKKNLIIVSLIIGLINVALKLAFSIPDFLSELRFVNPYDGYGILLILAIPLSILAFVLEVRLSPAAFLLAEDREKSARVVFHETMGTTHGNVFHILGCQITAAWWYWLLFIIAALIVSSFIPQLGNLLSSDNRMLHSVMMIANVYIAPYSTIVIAGYIRKLRAMKSEKEIAS